MNSLKNFLYDRLFVAFVVVPTLCAVAYFGFIASGVYISQSQFIVRNPDKPSVTGIGVMFRSAAGFSNANEEGSAANEYIVSRDALHAINADDSFVRSYGDPKISIFNRYDPVKISSSFEDLYVFFKGKITVDDNETTGITVLTVRAFNAIDAQKFDEELLEMAEDTVNRLNSRAREDLIRFATQEVQEAETNAEKAALALAAYRNKHGVIDPERQASTQLQTLAKFHDALIATRAQLATMQKTTINNPGIPVLQNRISSLSQQLADEVTKIAGQDRSLATEASEYQSLVLNDQIAAKVLTTSVTSMEQAQAEARRKQTYIERIAQPSLPDRAGEPHRLRDIFATFILGLILWNIARMLNASIREHMD